MSATPAAPAQQLLDAYASLLVQVGLNLQPGQSMQVTADLEHAPFVRRVAEVAYRAGARFVEVVWRDNALDRARILYGQPDDLDFVPESFVSRARQAADESWCLLSLAGSSDPDTFTDVEAWKLARLRTARRRKARFLTEAQMSDQVPWCVAAVPTQAWARKVFPALSSHEAVAALWQALLHTVRADQPDPLGAWRSHNARLERIANTLTNSGVRTLHIVDDTPGPDGRPATDLAVGLTDAPRWIGGAATAPAGNVFTANMPTEEVFTTPHNRQVEGYVRSSKPGFPLERRVDGAFFRFVQGELVEYSAQAGQDVLDALFRIPGSFRLGEIALVDDRSPVNQVGVVFNEVLLDENCVSHMAFGSAYPMCTVDGESMTEEERAAAGINQSDTHNDFMIGTATMRVTGIRPDGSRLAIMENGRFVIESSQ